MEYNVCGVVMKRKSIRNAEPRGSIEPRRRVVGNGTIQSVFNTVHDPNPNLDPDADADAEDELID